MFSIKSSLAVAVIVLSVLSFTTYNAYADIYLKTATIKGDSLVRGFENDIQLSSLQFGSGKSVSLQGTTFQSSKISSSDVIITKQMDSSSPVLVNDLLVGKSLPTVDIYLTKIVNGNLVIYNQIELSNVLFTSYSVSSGGDNPTESIGLAYTKIATKFTQVNPDGTAGQSITSCWDIVQQRTCSFGVTDATPPATTDTISGTAGTNGWYTSPVTVSLAAQDNSGGSGVKSTTYTLDGGTQTTYSAPFTISGDSNHTLTFGSVDNAGNAEALHTVYIPIDTTPPVITVPANVTKEATGPLTIVPLGTANATDAVDGAVTVTNNATASYPVGTTIIQYNATDLAGNTASAYQSVTITDTTPPALSLPVQLMVQATGPSGAQVTYLANATDLVDGPVTPVCNPPSGSTFAFGNDSVTCTATDAHENAATGTFPVYIINKIPPTISIQLPQNNADVNTPTITVSGNASDIVSISSVSWKVDNGPVSTVSGITPGPTVNWSFTTGTLSLGPHTIEVNATDSAKLTTVSTVSITYAAPTVTITPPTGTGQITFNTNSGGFTSLGLISPPSLTTPPLPGSYPIGFFSWSITGFAPATSATISITSPTPLNPHSQYFKLMGSTWVAVPVIVHGNILSFTISDNGPFDNNPTAGIISDPGAVANPTNGRVTGGGNIGKGTNFGFEVTSDISKQNAIRGTFEYQDKYVKLNLHGNNISYLSVGPATSNATIAGTTSYERHDKHQSHGTNYSFVATISDPDKSGQKDTFSITVTNSTGYVVYQNTGTVKGHVEIHKFADHDDKSDSGISHGKQDNGKQDNDNQDKNNNNSKNK